MSGIAPITVVETPEFLLATRKLMSEEERTGRGKRGGARVIYFYRSTGIPLFALTAYANSEQADLSQEDRNDFRHLTKLFAGTYGRTKR